MNFFNRWCGHKDALDNLNATTNHQRGQLLDLERRLERSRILREESERRLHETSIDLIRTRAQRNDLAELLQEPMPDLEAVIDLLVQAKRATGLNNSGPATTRKRIDQAINLLKGER